MDNLLLEAIVRELRPLLVGCPVFRVSPSGPEALVLLFDDPARSRVLISVAPSLPRIHLTREPGRRGEEPSAFVAIAAHHLGGAVLAGIEKEPSDRVVRWRFAAPSGPGKSLVAEIFGGSSNLFLLDREDRILGFLRRPKSAFRRPAIGAPYEPRGPRSAAAGTSVPPPVEAPGNDPPRRPRQESAEPSSEEDDSSEEDHSSPAPGSRAGPRRGERAAGAVPGRDDPRLLTRKDVAVLAERSRREDHPLGDLMLEACPALGPLAAREVEHRALAGEDPYRVVEEWLRRAFEEGARGFVYAEESPGRLDPRRPPGPGRFLLSPLPLVSAPPGLTAHEFGSIHEAAEAYYGALAAGLVFRARRDALLAIARREAKRAQGIAAKVSRDLETMEGADRDRRCGEALLAGLTRAVREGESVIVPDPYDAEGGTVAVPIDPARTLQANADRYFHRSRKAERGRIAAEKRLGEQSGRCETMTALAGRISDAADDADLARAEEDLRGLGIGVGLERRRRREGAPAPPREAGVRLYTSRDGYEILVGKGAQENDRLTFSIASPEDFWLHASGASGAHVVVRNPRSEARLPAATLREAAELAAFYSKAKEAGRVDVHVTRRKYVRRIRGAPRGTVTLKRHETVTATPRHPFE